MSNTLLILSEYSIHSVKNEIDPGLEKTVIELPLDAVSDTIILMNDNNEPINFKYTSVEVPRIQYGDTIYLDDHSDHPATYLDDHNIVMNNRLYHYRKPIDMAIKKLDPINVLPVVSFTSASTYYNLTYQISNIRWNIYYIGYINRDTKRIQINTLGSVFNHTHSEIAVGEVRLVTSDHTYISDIQLISPGINSILLEKELCSYTELYMYEIKPYPDGEGAGGDGYPSYNLRIKPRQTVRPHKLKIYETVDGISTVISEDHFSCEADQITDIMLTESIQDVVINAEYYSEDDNDAIHILVELNFTNHLAEDIIVLPKIINNRRIIDISPRSHLVNGYYEWMLPITRNSTGSFEVRFSMTNETH